jgi:hypothetical protein
VSKINSIRLASTGLPLIALICMASLGRSSLEHAEARHRAVDAARSIAQKIDAQFASTEGVLNRLGVKLSTNPVDVDANDALLRREQSEMPKSIANILLLSPDGRNIGNAVGRHASAGDRDYFKRASAGNQLVVELPIRSRSGVGWVVPVARRMSSNSGSTQAVLVVAISVDSIRELIGANNLPPGSLVRVVTEDEIEVAFVKVATSVGPELNRMGNAPRQFRLVEGSELLTSNGSVVRVIGFSRTQRVPWLVTVGLPAEVSSALVAERP